MLANYRYVRQAEQFQEASYNYMYALHARKLQLLIQCTLYVISKASEWLGLYNPYCHGVICPRAYRVRRTRGHATSMLRVETSK